MPPEHGPCSQFALPCSAFGTTRHRGESWRSCRDVKISMLLSLCPKDLAMPCVSAASERARERESERARERENVFYYISLKMIRGKQRQEGRKRERELSRFWLKFLGQPPQHLA